MAISIMEGTKIAVLAIESFINRAKNAFLTFAASRAGEFFGLQLTDVEKLQVELINLEREISSVTKKLENSDKALENQFNLELIHLYKEMQICKKHFKAMTRANEELGANVPKQSENVLNFLDEMIAAIKKVTWSDETFWKFRKGLTDQLDPVAKFKYN